MPSVDVFCAQISSEIKSLGLEYPKTIIFCQRYPDVSALYFSVCKHLQGYITFPPNKPIVSKFFLVNMYTRASSPENKDQVLYNFSDSKGKLRLVIAMSAFGLGVDCPDIRVVYYWGPPATVEEYTQESGRAGRDGLQSKSTLLYGKPGKFVTQGMKEYSTNNEICQRKFLNRNFLFNNDEKTDNCCDICNQ